MANKITLSVIKADIGGFVGHSNIHEALLEEATERMETARRHARITDFHVTHCGDDLGLIMTHYQGVDSPEIHQLAWEVFAGCTEVARELKLYGTGQDLLADAFSGNVRGMGPGVAEMSFEERPAEPVIVYFADKTSAGAWNLPLYRMFADPFNTAGLVISPAMHEGFRFEVSDVKAHRQITFDTPEESYDLLVFIEAPGHYVVHLYISGRASTLIVLEGGKKIQPDPLEEIYQENQFIREIGILYQDNQLVALIVPEIEAVNRLRNRDVEQAIREAISERVQALPSYQRFTDYAVTETPLARTNLGKLRRHELVKHYNQAKQGIVRTDSRVVGPLPLEDMSEKDQALLDHRAARQVWEWLAGRYPDKLLTPDTSPQLDLGVDSLEWLTLTLHVSAQTGVELSDQAIGRISTVRDLLQEVLAASESEVITPAAVEHPEALLTDEQKKWLSPPHPALRAVGAIVLPLFRGLARLLFQVKICGLEHLPRQGNVVLTPNHSSMLDGPLLAAALPYTFMRQTHLAAAADIMLTNPLVRLISRIGQVLPIERFGAGTGVQNLALAMAVLQRQKNLVWFPEGRISPTDKMLPFREGIGLVLDQQPVLVVPVFIQGTREAMPLQATFPKLRPVTIIVGQPYHPRDLARQAHGETVPARIVRALQDRVAALADQAGDIP